MFAHVRASEQSSVFTSREEAPDYKRTCQSLSSRLRHSIADFTVGRVHQKRKCFEANTGCGREATQNPARGRFDRQKEEFHRCYIVIFIVFICTETTEY